MSVSSSPVVTESARRAHELPGAHLEHPFGPGWDVWKVCGKVFALHTEDTGESMVIVKTLPEEGLTLRAEFPQVTPGYHMNKKHWISIVDGVPAGLTAELVTESYRLVVAGLPRRLQPVNPETFGLPNFPLDNTDGSETPD